MNSRAFRLAPRFLGPRHRLAVTATPAMVLAGLVAIAGLALPYDVRAAAGTAEPGTTADAVLVFSAIADVPQDYTSEVSSLEQHVRDHDTYSPSDFLLHCGDIKGGNEPCEEFRYQRVADILKTLTVPAYVMPGDNDTVDCSDTATGWTLWKRYFLRFEEFFCGAPETEHQSIRTENVAFVKNGVLFVGLDLVGSDSQAQQDDAAWVTAQLQAKKPSVRAAVVFSHEGPGSSSLASFFNPFVGAAATFGKPILYLHGHGHSWIQDRPFPTATNVLRTQLERGVSPPVQITVTLDAVNPFQFVRNPWPTGTQPYNRPPCVNAGPDQVIALGQQAALAGSATDNWVPYNPPRLVPAWSRVGGPGNVVFATPAALGTTASFDAAGSYVLRLTVSDGAVAASDDVGITVLDPGSNQPPIAANDTYEVERDLTLSTAAPGVLANDSDPEHAALTTALVSPPQHGTLALAANGGFSYTPTTLYVGQDRFTYRASDGMYTSNIATVTINVGIRFATFVPTHDTRVSSGSPASNYGTSSTLRVQAGTTLHRTYLKFDVSGIGPVQNAQLRLYVTDGSPDGGALYSVANEYAGTTTPWTETGINWSNAPALVAPTLATAGAVTAGTWVAVDLTSTVHNGTMSFGMSGGSSDATYYSSKEGGNAPQLVVTYYFGAAANHSPVAVDDSRTSNEDAAVVVPAPGVLANDTDEDGDALTASVAASPAHGTVALQANGGFTYTPAANWNGTDSFTYTVRDGLGGADVGTVVLHVQPLPDAPVATTDAYSVVVNNVLSQAPPGVLANDVDADGDALTVVLLGGTSHGLLALQPDGSFTYAPSTNFIGSDGFTYRVQDPGGLQSSASVTVQVTPPPPVTLVFTPTADTYVSSSKPTSNYGSTADLRLRDSSTDYHSYLRFVVSGIRGTLLSAKLRFYVTDGGADGGTFYKVSNNALNTSTPWTETGLNWSNAPALGVTAAGTAGAVAAGTWAEVVVTSAIAGDATYCFGALNRSSNQVAYASREAVNRPQLVLLVQESPVAGNRPPVASADIYSLDEDTELGMAAPGVLANDVDPDGNALAATSPTVPAHGTLDLRADGSFTYTPAANFNGTDSFTYRADDGLGGSTTANVALTVRAVNDAPVAVADAWQATAGQPLVVAAPGVLANDTDIDGTPSSAVLVSSVTHGSLTLAADGSFTYTSELGFTGTDGFSYRASDGNAESAPANVVLTVSSGPAGGALAFEEVQSGGAASTSSVSTTAPLAAIPGQLYIAAVTCKSSLTVTNVTGMGLTWTRIRSQCAGRAQTSVEVWVGRGTPSSGTVTATLQSTASNAALLVARYSGVDAATPVGGIVSGNTLGVNGVCSGGTDNATIAFDLPTTPGNLAFAAIASRSKALAPGSGFVKRAQVYQGIDSGSMASVSIMDKSATGTPTRVDATLASSTDWAMVAVEIRAGAGAAKTAASVETPAAALFRIYPNPARRGGWIEYRVETDMQVGVWIYNARGQHVRTLAAEPQVAGMWRLYWDGLDGHGVQQPAGIYFVRVRLGAVIDTRKLVFER